MDIATVMGLVFTPIIVVLSLLVHKTKRDSFFLYLGVAFIVFFLSYVISFSSAAAMLTDLRNLLRLVAYLVFIFGLFRRVGKRTS